jgi:hypothetical protein
MKMDDMDEVGNLHNMNNVDEIGKTYPTNDHMDETLITSTKALNGLTLLVIDSLNSSNGKQS